MSGQKGTAKVQYNKGTVSNGHEQRPEIVGCYLEPLTPDARVVRHPDAAVVVVGDGCHLPGAPGPVLVVPVVLGHRVVVVVVDVLEEEGEGGSNQHLCLFEHRVCST